MTQVLELLEGCRVAIQNTLFRENPEDCWERLKMLAKQQPDRLGIPAAYMSKELGELNEKQIRKVHRVVCGKLSA